MIGATTSLFSIATLAIVSLLFTASCLAWPWMVCLLFSYPFLAAYFAFDVSYLAIAPIAFCKSSSLIFLTRDRKRKTPPAPNIAIPRILSNEMPVSPYLTSLTNRQAPIKTLKSPLPTPVIKNKNCVWMHLKLKLDATIIIPNQLNQKQMIY